MPSYGPVHKLIVRKVGGSYGPLDTSEFEQYEIEHPAECATEQHDYGNGHVVSRYTCGVETNADAAGVCWSLHYTGTPVTEPGEYRIQAWSEKYVGFEYTEYDGGIALIEDD